MNQVCILPAKAQTQKPPPNHQHAPQTVDGAVHPELIPDAAAYRLYFVTVSTGANPSNEDRKRQQAQLNMIGLPEVDRDAFIALLAEFRAKHDELAQQFNRSAKAALDRNEAPDVDWLTKQLDQLVSSTRQAASVRLSHDGLVQLDAFVQSEKKHMRVRAGKL